MLSYAILLLFTISCVNKTSAFTFSKASSINHTGPIRHLDHNSSTKLSAYLDDISHESNQDRDTDQMCYLSLKFDKTYQRSDRYILECLVDIVGMEYGDAYDAIYHTKGIIKAAILDEFPRKKAEYYYNQLTDKGLLVCICLTEE